MANLKKIILIPAYEPDQKLIELLKELNLKKLDIIVVDDGSGKEYKNVFDKANKYATVLSYEENKGKGHALKTGLKYIKEKFDKDYVIVTMDSDGQHTVTDALNLASYVEKHPKEVAIGKRKRDTGNVPLRSRFGNGLTRFVYRVVSGVSLYDTQSGLRCFSDKLIDLMISIRGNRYEYEMNVILECPRRKIKLHEIEIATIYIENNSGSHFKPLRDSWRIYKQIFKFSLSSIVCFALDYISFIILLALSKDINMSNIIARIISGTANYTINKRLVFNSDRKVTITLIQYVLLAAIILLLNTLTLNLFVVVFGWNEYIAKVITEVILFTFSWFMQNKVIFRIKV